MTGAIIGCGGGTSGEPPSGPGGANPYVAVRFRERVASLTEGTTVVIPIALVHADSTLAPLPAAALQLRSADTTRVAVVPPDTLRVRCAGGPLWLYARAVVPGGPFADSMQLYVGRTRAPAPGCP